MSEIGFLPFKWALLFTATHVNVKRVHLHTFSSWRFRAELQMSEKGVPK